MLFFSLWCHSGDALKGLNWRLNWRGDRPLLRGDRGVSVVSAGFSPFRCTASLRRRRRSLARSLPRSLLPPHLRCSIACAMRSSASALALLCSPRSCKHSHVTLNVSFGDLSRCLSISKLSADGAGFFELYAWAHCGISRMLEVVIVFRFLSRISG